MQALLARFEHHRHNMKLQIKKISLIVLSSFALLFVCGGCANQKVASDLAAYVNDGILKVADMETQALAAYAGVVGTNYTSDQAVYDVLRHNVVPLYGQFLIALKDITPQTSEVRQLHALYLRGAEIMLQGFETKLLGLETGRVSLILEGNAAIEKGRVQTERWRARLFTYFHKYEIDHKKGNNA